jgi:plastocyanin
MFKAATAATPIRDKHRMKRLAAILTLALFALATPLFVHAKPAKPATVNVAIKGMKYTPASVTIKAGDNVVWTNADQRDHTVVAGDGSFSSGNIGPAATFSFAFTKPGKFEYSCSLHPRMKGIVIVQ